MKTIGRILIILLAASVVVTVAWALTRNGEDAQFSRGEGRFRPEGDFENEEFVPDRPDQLPEGFNPGERPEGFMENARGFKRQVGRFIPLGMIKDFGVIAVIVVVFVFAEYLIGKKNIKRVGKVPEDDTQAI